jgi:hypothetical protein
LDDYHLSKKIHPKTDRGANWVWVDLFFYSYISKTQMSCPLYLQHRICGFAHHHFFKGKKGRIGVCSSSSLQRKEGEDLGLLIIISSKERRGGFVFAHHHLFKGKKGRIWVCSSSSLQRKEGEDLGLLIIICSKERRGGFVLCICVFFFLPMSLIIC